MPGKYTYGPVPSRRLGFSLGIDIVPMKTCSYNCIYCQLGTTTNNTIERKEYTPRDRILQEVKDTVKQSGHIDYLTFSGSGEPTLHAGLGYLITELKKITPIPIAVLTNGSLLFESSVQRDLINADVVVPTLCTTSQEIFQEIHRPHASLTIEKIIQGLIDFRKKYRGKIWLEIMLVKGINDSETDIEKLHEVVEKISPDKIHLNTVVRPPSEKRATPLSYRELEKIRNMLGAKPEIIAPFKETREAVHLHDIHQSILNIIERRPVTLDDIAAMTGLHKNEILKYCDQLQKEKKILVTEHDGHHYYEVIGEEIQ
ncbi:MAG: radical SAM protein [candidate division WOR-3 bacterium]|nr:MAG: radical SAM protein [candidate division WOR-3 bacterium]